MLNRALLLCCIAVAGTLPAGHGQPNQSARVKPVVFAGSAQVSNIRGFAQDAYGFLWMASQDGLYVYDGRNTNVFNAGEAAPRRLMASDIRAVEPVEGGRRLVCLASYGGPAIVDASARKIVYQAASPYKADENWNTCMAIKGHDAYVGSLYQINAFNLKTGASRLICKMGSATQSSQAAYIRQLYIDSFGQVLALSVNHGLMLLTPGRQEPFIEPAVYALLRQQTVLNALHHLGNNQYALATSRGLLRFTTQPNGQIVLLPWPGNTATVLQQLQVNSLCNSTNNEQVYLFAGNQLLVADVAFKQISPVQLNRNVAARLFIGPVEAAYAMPDGQVWAASNEGLWCIQPRADALQANPLNSHIYQIAPGHNAILLGTSTGISVLPHGGTKAVTVSANGTVYGLFAIANSQYMASATSGLYLLRNNTLTPWVSAYPEWAGMQNNVLNSMVALPGNEFLFGTENNNGVLWWKPLKKQLIHIHPANTSNMQSPIVNGLYKASDSTVLAFSDNYVMQFVFSKTGLRAKSYTIQQTSIRATGNLGPIFDGVVIGNDYWLAVYGHGLVRTNAHFQTQEIINQTQNLSNNGVYKLFSIGDTALLASTNNGLNYLHLPSRQVVPLHEQDGLHHEVFEEGCGTKMNDTIYLGGNKGFTAIDVTKLTFNTSKPRVYLQRLAYKEANKQTEIHDLHLQQITVPPNTVEINLALAAIEWAEPEKLSFYYRLQDQQAAQWQPLPTNPTLQLIGYSPGTYQLEFKAHNSYGLASDIKALTLTIQPPWHQTWWFKVAVLLVLLGAGYLLYRYRLSQVLARERMRQRIAADLHDDIGSTLASVHMYTNLALQRQQSQYLHLIKEGVLDAYQSTRDMIWMMKSEYNSLGALAAQVRKFATPVSQATGMHWQMHLPALLEDYRLSFDQRRHLYMMLKEFVNNSAKYSQANTLKFVVEAEQNGVMLSMADDGCGFVPDDKQNGNGLKNMERRAAEIGARFQLFSQPGKGTCMVIHLARLPGAGHKPKKPYVG